eukprot:3901473-Pyramimonas_sp.AAC.1
MAKQGAYRRTVEQLRHWFQLECSSCPSRSVPILKTDLNNETGMHAGRGSALTSQDGAVPAAGASEERYAGAVVRNLLSDHYMEATSTRSGLDTYHVSVTSSHVDFACLSASLGDA